MFEDVDGIVVVWGWVSFLDCWLNYLFCEVEGNVVSSSGPESFLECGFSSDNFVNPIVDLVQKHEDFVKGLSCDEVSKIINFMGELSSSDN